MSIHDKISKNNIQLFKSGKIRNVDRKARKMEDLRSDCSLFSRLFLFSQREGRRMNLEEFFMHENQRYPPSISEHGHLYTGSKSDLLDCLESLSQK